MLPVRIGWRRFFRVLSDIEQRACRDREAFGSQATVEDEVLRREAVNAGSDELSVFSVQNATDLTLLETIPSGGLRPVSVAVSGSLV